MPAHGKNKVLGNASALFIIQLSNYVLPFLLTPYLTRVLGSETYGIAAIGFSIVQLSGVLTDYGFGLYATYLIAKSQNCKKTIKGIIGSVYACKAIILSINFAIISLLPYFNERFLEHKEYFWTLNIAIIGIALQPVWIFQGLEKMRLITIYTVISRIVFLFLCIALVRANDDLIWVAISNGASQILAAGLGLWFVFKLEYKPIWRGWGYTFSIFKESSEFFISRAAVATYGAGATFFLGIASTPTQVAFYSVAEQFYRGAISVFSPISQALYPHMAKSRDIEFFKKIFLLAVIATLLGVTLGFIFGESLLTLIFGIEYIHSKPVLLILLIALLAAIPSILLGYPFLGAIGDSRSANKSVIYAGTTQLSLMAVCVITKNTQATDIAITVLIAEFTTLTYRAIIARKHYKIIKSQK